MARIAIIVNPNAKKGKCQKELTYISDYFLKKGEDVTVFKTQKAGDAIAFAKEACEQGYDIVIAAGGDGTVNECADGIMRAKRKAKLGIIPIGRGNDYAWVAKIPTNIKDACDLILNGKAKKVDVGYIVDYDSNTNRYFLNGAGFGFEPAVNFKASSYKHLNGMPSYVMAFIYTLCHIPKPIKTHIIADGKTYDINTQQISVCNGRRMGSAFIMAPNGKIDDGKIDLVFSNAPISSLELFNYAFRFFKGTQLKTKKFEEHHVKHVSIELEDKIPVHADGEKINYGSTHCDIDLLEGALEVFHG